MVFLVDTSWFKSSQSKQVDSHCVIQSPQKYHVPDSSFAIISTRIEIELLLEIGFDWDLGI